MADPTTAPGAAPPVKPGFGPVTTSAGAAPVGAVSPNAPAPATPHAAPGFSSVGAGLGPQTKSLGTIVMPELGGNVAPRSAAQMIIRLQNSNDDGKKLAEDLMRKYGPDLQSELEAQGAKIPKGMFGVPITYAGEQKRTGKGALGTFFNVIGRPGQAVMQGIRAGASVVREATGGEEIAGNRGFAGVVGALRGTEAPINMREMEGFNEEGGYDKDQGGKYWGFRALADMTGQAVLDPVSYLSTGTSEVAKLGLQALGKTVEEQALKAGVEETAAKVLGEEILEKVAKEGFKKAVPQEIKDILKENLKIIGKDAAGDKGVRQAFRGVFGKEAREGGVRYAERTLEELNKAAQGGLKIAGTTVIGEGNELGKILTLPGKFAKGAVSPITKPIAKFINEAVLPRAKIIAKFGKVAGHESGDVASLTAAEADRLRNDAIFRMSEKARSAGDELDEATMARIFEAREQGPEVFKKEMAALRSEGKAASATAAEEIDQITREYSDALVKSGLFEPSSVLTEVRQGTEAVERARLTRIAEKPVEKAEKAAAKTAKKTERQAEEQALYEARLVESTAGKGRKLTAAEHERIAVAKRDAGVAARDAGKLEEAVAKGEPGSAEARAKAFDEAITKESSAFSTRSISSPKNAAEQIERAKARVVTAAKELEEYERTVMKPGARAWKVTPRSQIEQLGRLEGKLEAASRGVRLAEAQAKRVEGILERTVTRAQKRAIQTLGRDERTLVAAAERARARANKLIERQHTLQKDVAEKAALGDKAATASQQQRIGALTERARAAKALDKEAQRRLESTRAAAMKALAEVPDKVAVKGEEAVQRYLKSNPVLMNVDKYMPHILTKEGKKALADAGWIFQEGSYKQASQITKTLRQGMHGESRELIGTAKEINEMLADILEQPEGFKFFDTNPFTVTAKRLDEAYRATSEVAYIDGMRKLGEKYGGDWVVYGKDITAEEAKDRGLVLINGRYLEGIWAAKDIAPEIERLQAVVYNDEAIGKWERAVDHFGSLWAGYATTPIMFGTGFFARNAMGNMFNNFLAGISNPALYTRAFKLQHAASDAAKETGRKLGPEFEAALAKRLGADGARDARLFVQAQETGALGTGFFSMHDIGNSRDLNVTRSRRSRTLQSINPLSKQNILLKPGASLNAAIENNARLAHFLGKMDEHGDAILAARSVKKFLFDYSDLTAFEKYKMRRFIRFYTYLRKNTPLQFSMIIHEPGKMNILGHAYKGGAAGSSDKGPFPNYATNQMDVPINGVMFGADTPLQAAMTAVTPIANTLGSIPGVRNLLPNSLRPEGGPSEVARSFLAVPSGGIIEPIKAAVEITTGKSLFTGGDQGSQTQEKAFIRLGKAIMPMYSKEESLRKNVFNLDGRDQARARLLTSILGLHVTVLDDKAREGEYKRIFGVATDSVDKLKAEGVDVPTISELQTAGIIPTPKKAKSAKPKTAGARRAEAIAALIEGGMDPEQAASGEFGPRPSLTRKSTSKKGSLTGAKKKKGKKKGSLTG
jgi:hypothetical protein